MHLIDFARQMWITDSGMPLFSAVSDYAWMLEAPYPRPMDECAPRRQSPIRELFKSLSYLIRYQIAGRGMPNDMPTQSTVYQQSRLRLAVGCFEALAWNLPSELSFASGREVGPVTAVVDSRTLRSMPESGLRAGYNRAKRKGGSKLNLAIDAHGHFLALYVAPASVDD